MKLIYQNDLIRYLESVKAANRVMESITKFIEKKLGLKVNVEYVYSSKCSNI